MTSEKAIRTAIEFETRVHAVYNEAVKRSADPVGKGIFSALAKEEQGHLDFLNSKLEELKKTGEIKPEKVLTALPSFQNILKKAEGLKKRIGSIEKDDEIAMLKKALEVELKTSEFYREMTRTLSGEIKEMFAQFLIIEEGHKSIVQAEIDHVGNSGFWLDFQEFDMEH